MIAKYPTYYLIADHYRIILHFTWDGKHSSTIIETVNEDFAEFMLTHLNESKNRKSQLEYFRSLDENYGNALATRWLEINGRPQFLLSVEVLRVEVLNRRLTIQRMFLPEKDDSYNMETLK